MLLKILASYLTQEVAIVYADFSEGGLFGFIPQEVLKPLIDA